MTARTTIGSAVLIAALGWGGELDAQDGPAMVPMELVRALISPVPFGPRDSEAPEIVVGELAEELHDVPIPSGGRVIGGLSSPRLAVAVIAVAEDPGQARRSMDELMTDAGGRRPVYPQNRGFVSTPYQGLVFCMGESVQVSVTVTEREEGGSLIKVGRMEIPRSVGPCREEGATTGTMGRRESPIPSLAPPAGVESRGGGSGGGGGDWHADARLRTDLSPGDLVAHYGDQLRALAWEPVERSVGEGVAVEVFRMEEDDGPWRAVLMATVIGGGDHRFVELQMVREDRFF